ncbi:hypothetical protein EAF04_001501 [Stromatinia cepivora]|nr:hypothetical protein EAF04_001501 [Stromatinia cepivora]
MQRAFNSHNVMMLIVKNSWADGPWGLIEAPGSTQDTKKHAAINEMAHLHNCIIRGINCVYLQAPHVRAVDDIQDFLFFIKAWCSFVKHHHDVEEELVFPQLEAFTGQKGCMSANVAQHQIFEPGLHELAEYAEKTLVSDFNATKICSLIDGFVGALQNHLKAEVPTLLALQPYESEGIMKIFKECEAAGFNQPNDIALPLILGLSDITSEYGKYVFPAVPGFARYLVHYWYRRAHQGIPRPLAFLD